MNYLFNPQAKLKLFGISLLVVLTVSISCTGKKETGMVSDVEQKVENLLAQMTLEEKVGQMLNLGLPAVLPGDYWGARDTAILDTARMEIYLKKYGAGCIHNTPGYPPTKEEWYHLVKGMQDYIKNNSRLGIPIIYGIDNIHGANYVLGSTMMPNQIALAATWNPEKAYITGKITSYESRAASLPWNYNPNADVATQPLWGRIGESWGEDPYLISEMTVAYVKGSQHEGLQDSTTNAVCVKHFLGYGAGTNGKDRANAIIPENYLRQYFIPPFKEAVEAGAMSIMLSSNAVNGMPCHMNKYIITDILKGELGFQGVVVSDFSDVEFLIIAHQSAGTFREATKLAINAGLDMAMHPYNATICDTIIDLVNNGEIMMSRIDDAVRRILRLKYSLNLFDVPYTDPAGYTKFGSEEYMKENYDAAAEAITLLKNEDILPLEKNAKILITGYAANSMNVLNGAWSRTFLGLDTRFNDPSKQTILDAVKSQAGEKNVTYVEGTNYLDDINTDVAVAKARNVDYIIACLGEIPATEKPSDINELPMPEAQQELVKKLAKTGKPIIIVLVEARPRIIKDIEPLADGIIMAYLPGDEGGRAVADVIFGDINPGGKLPYTYPKYTGNALVYWHKKTDIRDPNWGFNGFYPQYQFGYGLSYTTYEYSNLTLSLDTLTGDQELKISVDVKNTGDIAGKEIVEIFIKDLFATISPDVRKLVRFDKIELNPGETKTVEFVISSKDMTYVDLSNNWIVEDGDFEVHAGGNPDSMLIKKFYYKN
ncbi:MAG: glycoside hydrolase family 3 C-terminal domain-containing protein [Bacteroidales bacterium]|nr:glycoside hydrolase family 3 C-terminal domain-containing protein [Bacteroidales bacterium]